MHKTFLQNFRFEIDEFEPTFSQNKRSFGGENLHQILYPPNSYSVQVYE